ncbi:MAG: hypothetical protein D3910_19900 [Candidatus Electrothrix sp. ATG2]|nr:hypothetical protein [Candidatus Electrothrix sp. ATG2]
MLRLIVAVSKTFFGREKFISQKINHCNTELVMNEKRAEQERINELKNKIHYAETVRDSYKNTHAILYETNSFYIDTLKQELNGLEFSEGA